MFTFELGLAPEFELALSKKQKLTRYLIEPDAKMIADYVDNYARRHGEFIIVKKSEEKDLLKGTIASADGTITNDDATLSVDAVKDDKIKKEFIGKKAGDNVTFDIRQGPQRPVQHNCQGGVKVCSCRE
jgi:trigger factor